MLPPSLLNNAVLLLGTSRHPCGKHFHSLGSSPAPPRSRTAESCMTLRLLEELPASLSCTRAPQLRSAARCCAPASSSLTLVSVCLFSRHAGFFQASKQAGNSEPRLLSHLCTLASGLIVKHKERLHKIKHTDLLSRHLPPHLCRNPPLITYTRPLRVSTRVCVCVCV